MMYTQSLLILYSAHCYTLHYYVIRVFLRVDASADPDRDRLRTVFRFRPSRSVRFARVHPMLNRLLSFQW